LSIFVALLTIYNKEKRRKYHILKCQHWTVMLLLTHTIIFTCFNEIFVQKWQYLEICNIFLPNTTSLIPSFSSNIFNYIWKFVLYHKRQFIINYHYFINGTILSGFVALLTLYCHQEKERVINLKTIHRGKNQLVFFQALVLPSFNDNCFLK
jgi:hypothetical protein